MISLSPLGGFKVMVHSSLLFFLHNHSLILQLYYNSFYCLKYLSKINFLMCSVICYQLGCYNRIRLRFCFSAFLHTSLFFESNLIGTHSRLPATAPHSIRFDCFHIPLSSVLPFIPPHIPLLSSFLLTSLVLRIINILIVIYSSLIYTLFPFLRESRF